MGTGQRAVSVMWAILAALGLGVIANNLYDVMPWLAHRILRHAAKLEAETPDETPLIYDESVAVLDEVPGKLTQLLFAIGRLTHALRHLQRRPRRRRSNALNERWLGVTFLIGSETGVVALMVAGMAAGVTGGLSGWVLWLTVSGAAVFVLGFAGLVVTIWRRKQRSR